MVLRFSLSALLLAATCLAHISQRNVVDRAAMVINEDLSTVGVPIDQISRQIRAANPPVALEVPLNDNNPRGLIHYSGNDSKVIFVLTFSASGTTVTTSNLWRSSDYGGSFTKINTQLETSGSLTLYPFIYISPVDYCTILIPHASQPIVYISTNEGASFIKKTFSISGINPRSLNFHPTKGKWFLAHDRTNERLYVSMDFGYHFTLIDSNVNSTSNYQWGVYPYDTDSTLIYYNTNGDTSTDENHLYTQRFPYKSSNKKEFDPAFGDHDDFLIVNRYMFAQKTVNGLAKLYVSYDRKNFQQAHVSSALAHQNYYVDDIKAKQALVIVEHTNGQYNLYLSEETGQYFSLSMPDIILSDLEYIESMNYTTYICNQYVRSSASVSNPPKRTLISFDAGGNWETLRPPANAPQCIQPTCSLHLHMSSSEYWRTGVYSQSSAPGIIIAHGATGLYFNASKAVDLYISRDGGSTWTKALSSSWGVSVLDNGGLIVAAQDYHQYISSPSRTLKYSCNEGASWSSFNFASSNVVIFGVVTEPGESTAVVSLYGWRGTTSGWTVIRVNFTNIFSSMCIMSDYYVWKPYDETTDTGCLLGASVSIERRIADHCCLSGTSYVRALNYTLCSCSEDDFECDYGYKHANGISGPCVKDYSINLPDPCSSGVTTYMKSQGYRKIGGDVCSGGVENQYNKVLASCCDAAINTTSSPFSSSSHSSSLSSILAPSSTTSPFSSFSSSSHSSSLSSILAPSSTTSPFSSFSSSSHSSSLSSTLAPSSTTSPFSSFSSSSHSSSLSSTLAPSSTTSPFSSFSSSSHSSSLSSTLAPSSTTSPFSSFSSSSHSSSLSSTLAPSSTTSPFSSSQPVTIFLSVALIIAIIIILFISVVLFIVIVKVFMKKKGRTIATRAVYSRIPRDNSEELTMFRNEDIPIGINSDEDDDDLLYT